MNPLIQGHSGTTPETSWNAFGTNQGTNEDDSLRDLHPEAGIFRSQTTQNTGPEVGHVMVTGAQKKSLGGHDSYTKQSGLLTVLSPALRRIIGNPQKKSKRSKTKTGQTKRRFLRCVVSSEI